MQRQIEQAEMYEEETNYREFMSHDEDTRWFILWKAAGQPTQPW